MPEIWQIAALWAACAVCAAASAALTAFAFALAARKFSADARRKLPESSLGAAARFCCENGGRIAGPLALSARALAAFSAAFAYFAAAASLERFGVETGAGSRILLALAAAAAVALAEYGILGIPAARFAAANPEKVLRKIAPIFVALYAVVKPAEFAAEKIGAKLAGKRLSGRPPFGRADVEIMLRAEEADGEPVSPYAGKIARNAIRLQELDVSDAMLPRSKVEYFDIDEPYSENLKAALRSRHNRYPLCRGGLDDCYGIIHLRDLFAAQAESETPDLSKIARQTLRLRENENLESALAKMLGYKIHMALVEDDFGGVIGVLTLDAALGELVGQIRDEFAVSQGEPIRVIGKNKYKISGLAPIRRVEDFLDVDFNSDEVSTFGGLITLSLGRFPERGERIYFKEQRMRVVVDRMEARTVGECTAAMEAPDASGE